MPRVDTAFVQYPLVTIVNSLHPPAQQTTRADQERRDDVANDGRAEDAHQLVIEWTVVIDGADQDEFFNTLGIVECARRSHGAAVRTAGERCALDSESIEQTDQHPRL